MMKRRTKKISGGVYLVLNPSMKRNELIKKLKGALDGGVSVVQIWNQWPGSFSQKDKEMLICEVLSISTNFDVPVLINEEWELLKITNLDGVHFDTIPDDYRQIQQKIGKGFIAGITCSNDLNVIRWADENDFDYVSFCSMFPSNSVDSCEIVRSETVQRAKEITDMPLFVSGGITAKNLSDLGELDFQGVAVISGIMNSESPEKTTGEYNEILKSLRTK